MKWWTKGGIYLHDGMRTLMEGLKKIIQKGWVQKFVYRETNSDISRNKSSKVMILVPTL